MELRQSLFVSVAVAAIASGTLLLSEASAADTVPPKSSLWEGFYAGTMGGYASGKADIEAELRREFGVSGDLVSEDGKADLEGGMIGGLMGYDYNVGNGLVLGVLGDISWAGLTGDADLSSAVRGESAAVHSVQAEVNWFGTLRGRVGLELGDALIFATGGLAFAGVEADLDLDSGGTYSDSSNQLGWAVGAGVNYMVSDHIMLGLEYLYVDFGDQTYGLGAAGEAEVDLDMNVIRGSISYKF